MVEIDHYARLGFAVELLSRSVYHRQLPLGPYLRTEILPPSHLGQCRFYLQDNGMPTALVTWAWLSQEVEADLHATGRALTWDEWTCGDRLFFNDWITPYDNVRAVAFDLTHNVFPDRVATSLRRNADSTVRRVNRWTGANLRAQQAELVA
jgi:cytolysin-activating lysine-acyltransferase